MGKFRERDENRANCWMEPVGGFLGVRSWRPDLDGPPILRGRVGDLLDLIFFTSTLESDFK
jgi:hypothetical protein